MKIVCGLAWFDSTETVNWQRIDGKAKVGGVLVCVAGAIVMALYKGPVLLGDGFSDLNLQGMAMAGKPAPEPVSWLATLLIDAGVDMWHIGVVCLMGNCFCLAAYIVYQVPDLKPLHICFTYFQKILSCCRTPPHHRSSVTPFPFTDDIGR